LSLAGLLVWPSVGYFLEVNAFSTANQEYLRQYTPRHLLPVLFHNVTFLAGLITVSLAALVAREIARSRREAAAEATGESATEASTEPDEMEGTSAPADSPSLVWIGRVWLFLPQLFALLFSVGGQSVFIS